MFCERGVISAVDAKMDRDENHNKINVKRIFLNKNKFVILPKKNGYHSLDLRIACTVYFVESKYLSLFQKTKFIYILTLSIKKLFIFTSSKKPSLLYLREN